tara:strand:- start:103 stop:870 length:768 start_codon:yes stop_codon:yes gene_type:complete
MYLPPAGAQPQHVPQVAALPSVPQMPQMPQISEMLVREAEAWRALLALHGIALAGGNHAVASMGELRIDEDAEDASEQREAQYVAQLTSLMAQCDAMSHEIIKIRTLRRSRRRLQEQARREVVRAHSDETLALGSTLAGQLQQQVTALTTDIRLKCQTIRNELTQARALLQAIADAESSTLPVGATVVLGLRRGEEFQVHPVDEVLRAVYQHSESISEEGLVSALQRLAAPSEARAPAPAAAPARSVPRRTQGVG